VYSGVQDDSCKGYGKRDRTGTACFCVASDGSYLCRDAFNLASSSCDAPDGTRSFYDLNDGASCNGSALTNNPNTGALENTSKSGSAKDCSIKVKPTEWVDLDGKLACGG
jgi:hypothetical protein